MRHNGAFNRWSGGENSRSRRDDAAIERFLMPVETPPLRDSLFSGMKAGIIGGIVMIISLAYFSEINNGLLMPMRIVTFGITGDANLAESRLGALLGLAIHLVLTMGIGGVFGLLMAKFVGKVSLLIAMSIGGVYGLLTWIIGQNLIIPAVAPNMTAFYDHRVLILIYLIYGVSLGIFGTSYRYRLRIFNRRWWRIPG